MEGTVVYPVETDVEESCNTILKIYCCQGQHRGNWKLLAKRPTLYSINISKHLTLLSTLTMFKLGLWPQMKLRN